MGASQAQSVRRRRVFYIPGYDPFPPRRYRELFRTEAAEQARISGYTISQTPKKGPGPYGWHVTSQIDGQRTEAEINILIWTDIVKNSMHVGIAATYWLLVKTFWIYVFTGAIFRLFRLRIGPGIAAMYPVVMLLGQLAIALAAAYAVGRGVAFLMPWWLAHLIGLVVVPPILMAFRRVDGKFFVYYLLLDYAFTAKHMGRNPPELEARLAEFVALIGAALHEDLDEVLVVGHSSGVHLGVSILADLLRQGHAANARAKLGFLSLGHAVPMQSFLPHATRLRRDLHDLSLSDQLTWIDVTAPGDGCCYALCDPVAVSGAAPKFGQRWPLVLSAAFRQTLRPETYKKLKWRYFRLHFQYLCAFDAPGEYDYFQITAGPLSLQNRFKGRLPSVNMINTPLNRFCSMDPL
jgi:hypothetical protein